jgi:hypothetical protein
LNLIYKNLEPFLQLKEVYVIHSKKKRCRKEPSRVLAKILNLLRFHPFITKPSMVLDNLKNHAR